MTSTWDDKNVAIGASLDKFGNNPIEGHQVEVARGSPRSAGPVQQTYAPTKTHILGQS